VLRHLQWKLLFAAAEQQHAAVPNHVVVAAALQLPAVLRQLHRLLLVATAARAFEFHTAHNFLAHD